MLISPELIKNFYQNPQNYVKFKLGYMGELGKYGIGN